MLLEEFKGCLPAEIKTHLDEKKQRTCTNLQFGQMTMHSLVRVHYSLGMLKLQKKASGECQLIPREQTTIPNPMKKSEASRANLPSLPPGPSCFYCKQRGHVKAECRALQKNAKALTDPCKQCRYLRLQRVCSICFIGHGVPIEFLREDLSANTLRHWCFSVTDLRRYGAFF